MKTLKILTTSLLISCATTLLGQTNESNTKGNSSKETVTKITRIKGPNGEEKVIKKQEVITKKSKIKLNPGDEEKTNQTAIYEDEEVKVQQSHTSSENGRYTLISDGKGYRITFLEKSGNTTSKVRPLGSGYYNVHMGEKNNAFGHFDKDKNFVLETYDAKMDKIITTIYKPN